jgi:hypothetical protein
MTVRRRMRSTTAALCAVVLGLAACASDETPPATNPPATSAPSTPASTTPTTSSGSSSARSSAGAAGTALDAATITWFKSFCTEFAALANIGNANPTAGADSDTPQQKQAKLAAEMETAAAAFDNAATKLSSAPPPGISGGQVAATGVITGLKDIAKFIRDAGAEFKAASVTDEASLSAAQKATEDKMSGIAQVIQQKILLPLAPALSQLQGNEDKFPECAALSS